MRSVEHVPHASSDRMSSSHSLATTGRDRGGLVGVREVVRDLVTQFVQSAEALELLAETEELGQLVRVLRDEEAACFIGGQVGDVREASQPSPVPATIAPRASGIGFPTPVGVALTGPYR